jgi:hypothetical protein
VVARACAAQIGGGRDRRLGFSADPWVFTTDIARSDLGLLVQGNSDFGPIFGTGLVHGNQAVEERAMETGSEYRPAASWPG